MGITQTYEMRVLCYLEYIWEHIGKLKNPLKTWSGKKKTLPPFCYHFQLRLIPPPNNVGTRYLLGFILNYTNLPKGNIFNG